VIALDREMEVDQGLYLLRPEKSAPMKPEALLVLDWPIATFGEG
jgi:hypothetical protein